MHIAIVGAGITGLSAAYRLSLEGHRVTVFEASDTAGGLGSSIEVGNKHVERFYHHFFQSDRHVIELIRELGLSEKLHFYPSKTSVFHKGHVYPFSGPVDLLRFKPLSFADRIRCGLVLVYLKYAPVNNEKLDLIPAASWLKKYAGRESYRVIWEPLLVGKFEEWSDDIPLAWLKDRLRDRTFKLGYLESGAHTLFEELLLQIRRHKGEVRLSTPVTSIEERKNKVYVEVGDAKIPFDYCIVTTVSPIAAGLIKNNLNVPSELDPPMVEVKLNTDVEKIEQKDKRGGEPVRKLLEDQDQLGAVCVMLELDRRIQPHYWINVTDRDQPVLVAVEHTNLISEEYYGGVHIMYLANYIHRDRDAYHKSEQELSREYAAFLTKLNPKMRPSWIKRAHVSRVPRTQTIFKTGSLHNRPPNRLTERIFLGNIDQMYPHDRNLNLGVELGSMLAELTQAQQ